MTVVPHHVREELFRIERDGVALAGSLCIPAATVSSMPLVLLIAGSGPTDRDCNSPIGVRTDAHRMLAVSLADHRIASARYDKRGVGASGKNFDPARVTLGDFVADAGAIAEHLRSDGRFCSLCLAGHSEGGLIGLFLAQSPIAHALVLLATPGRSIAVLLREQLARQLDAPMLAQFDRLIGRLRRGEPLDSVPPALAPLLRPSVYAFLRSELDISPLALIHAARPPVAIIQGGSDAQVTVHDAFLLAAARPDAVLSLLPAMNHVLKEETSSALPQASYFDPSRPLAPGLVEAIVAAVHAGECEHGAMGRTSALVRTG